MLSFIFTSNYDNISVTIKGAFFSKLGLASLVSFLYTYLLLLIQILKFSISLPVVFLEDTCNDTNGNCLATN